MIKNGQNVVYRFNNKTYHCPLDITMDYIGGKWKAVILWYLKDKTLRFTELKKIMPDITEKTLSLQLKSLERSGLVRREVFGDKPPVRVEYSMTDFGRTLVHALNAASDWGRDLGNQHGGPLDA